MTIYLTTQRILEDIRIKSHLECQDITDMEARYRAEAGSEKTDEVRRDLVTATALLYSSLSRYLSRDLNDFAENGSALPDQLAFEFTFSERRQHGKAQPLTDAMHAFLVNTTLSAYYRSASQDAFANRRAELAASDLKLIEQLVYTKHPPFFNNY